MATDNAAIGDGTIVEPGVSVGFRYHPDCGPARIGANGILRAGTLIYGDVTIGDYFQSGHNTVIRAKVRMGNYCTVTNQSTLEGLIRFGDGVRVMSHVYIHSRSWFGDRVFVGTACATPRRLVAAVEALSPAPADVEFFHFLTTAIDQYFFHRHIAFVGISA